MDNPNTYVMLAGWLLICGLAGYAMFADRLRSNGNRKNKRAQKSHLRRYR